MCKQLTFSSIKCFHVEFSLLIIRKSQFWRRGQRSFHNKCCYICTLGDCNWDSKQFWRFIKYAPHLTLGELRLKGDHTNLTATNTHCKTLVAARVISSLWISQKLKIKIAFFLFEMFCCCRSYFSTYIVHLQLKDMT